MLVSMTAPLEALLFAAGSEGLTTQELADALQLTMEETKALCQDLMGQYDSRGAGIALVELAESWQLVTRPDCVEYIRRLATVPTSSHLSTAALEVLSIVAYRQPVSRMDVERTRGVQSDRAVATLVHRQLIHEVGREEAPGRPILYGTTDLFLQTFGLRSLADLPPLPSEEELPKDLSLFELTPVLPRD